MKSAQTKEKVIIEGAEIYCERRSNGPLLLMITGGMGDAGFYFSSARTTDMTAGQQARDAGAIIKAMGSDKAIIFWSSGGGITGLELAAVKPEVIDFLILHEPPVIELLPDTYAKRWRSFHHDIYMKSMREGWQAALPDFMASLVGAPDIPYLRDLNDRVSVRNL